MREARPEGLVGGPAISLTTPVRYPTDRQTDRPTDTDSYRGALSHLKSLKHVNPAFRFSQLGDIYNFPRPFLVFPVLEGGKKL